MLSQIKCMFRKNIFKRKNHYSFSRCSFFNQNTIFEGYNSETTMLSYGIDKNSSSLLITIQHFGMFIGTLILIKMSNGFLSLLHVQGFASFLYILIMILMLSTEHFVTKPIFMIFFFHFQKGVLKEGNERTGDLYV